MIAPVVVNSLWPMLFLSYNLVIDTGYMHMRILTRFPTHHIFTHLFVLSTPSIISFFSMFCLALLDHRFPGGIWFLFLFAFFSLPYHPDWAPDTLNMPPILLCNVSWGRLVTNNSSTSLPISPILYYVPTTSFWRKL